MKVNDYIKNIPSGGPLGDIIKIAAMIAATILVDKIGDVVKDITDESRMIDVNFKEE